ncbi:alpha/beta hydrolase [Arthrobacter sp. S39]|uniref:alpha/beta hydrolase n=1 Tax=Arthrobacter sp. S39 TaxID=2509720 RepID=UPI0010373AB9|nr:alpha/beta hydrolase [Arthrobacter sp. S39]TAP39108.1 alpha/beta hydrolase [Arthrobacter sp. S39]
MSNLKSALHYDPAARFEVDSHDVEYLNVDGVSLAATVFQPRGQGPFPMLIDVHGGGWRLFSRTRQRPIDLELASHGIVVVSLDFRQAPPTTTFTRVDGPHAPYPATFSDVNYGIRWFKAHAAEFNASADSVGALGVSSGAHNVLINAMLGQNAPFAALPLAGADSIDASLAYIICSGSPVDLVDMMVDANVTEAAPGIEVGELDFYGLHEYFGGVKAVTALSPLHIVSSRSDILTPPLLLVHGDADDMGGVSTDRQFTFAGEYAKAGGVVELAVYPDAPHIFLNRGLAPESENLVRALAGIAGFIQRQLSYNNHPFDPVAGLATGAV